MKTGEEGKITSSEDELAVSGPIHSWSEEEGVIYFSVTSDGTTGEDWIKRLEGKGFEVTDSAKQVLCSPNFKPTSDMTTRIAVLKGPLLFKDRNPITKEIRAEADKRKLGKPNAEVTCLICEKFTNEEIEAIGLWWIIVMHEPLKDSDGNSYLLYRRRNDNGHGLYAANLMPHAGWVPGLGFAFVCLPSSRATTSLQGRQVSSQH